MAISTGKNTWKKPVIKLDNKTSTTKTTKSGGCSSCNKRKNK